MLKETGALAITAREMALYPSVPLRSGLQVRRARQAPKLHTSGTAPQVFTSASKLENPPLFSSLLTTDTARIAQQRPHHQL